MCSDSWKKTTEGIETLLPTVGDDLAFSEGQYWTAAVKHYSGDRALGSIMVFPVVRP